MPRNKLIVVSVIVILVLVVIFQNMDAVDTRVLFATISMPRSLLLVIVFALGFLAGLLARLSLRKAKPTT